MKLTPLTALAALAIFGAGGFMAGRLSSDPAAEATPTSTAGTTYRSSQGASADGSSSPTKASSRDERRRDDPRASAAGGRLLELEGIVRGENPMDRVRALLDYIDRLAPGEFEDAVAYFRGLGLTEERMGEYSLLLTAWAEADPLAALAYAKENTGGGFAQDTILTTWATIDPQSAIRWAEANHDGDGPNPYLPGIIRGISGTDPARATALLASMPRSRERGKGLDFMLPHLLQQGTAATRTWIESLDDDALKNGAMLRVADNLATEDPAGTASWLLANPGEAQDRRMDDVYGIWASKDASAALNALSALPAGEARSDALRGVVRTVATENPQEALSLMDRFPADVDDRIVQNFIWHSFGSDPTTAASQIARIGDDRQRERTYRRMLDNWMERDPGNARQWIATNPLPESVQNHLLRREAERQENR